MSVRLPLAKSVLVTLRLTASASATDAAIQKKIYGSNTTTLVFSNENLNDIMKIDKSLEGSGLLITGVSKTVENEVKKQKVGFLDMLAATLGASLLGNLLASKGLVKGGDRVIQAGEKVIRASERQGFQCCLIV